jgi:hypothetical protein
VASKTAGLPGRNGLQPAPRKRDLIGGSSHMWDTCLFRLPHALLRKKMPRRTASDADFFGHGSRVA